MKAAAIASILVLARVTIAAADDHNHNVPKIAFFGFQLINTSLEPSTPSEAGRIKLLDDLLRERLDNSGRFKMVPIPPEMQRRIAEGPEISGCNGASVVTPRPSAPTGRPGELCRGEQFDPQHQPLH